MAPYLRSKWQLTCLATCLYLLVGTSLAAAEPVSFVPTGNWNVDYQPDRCRLTRIVSNGQDELKLTIEKFEVGDWFSLAVSGPPIRDIPQLDAEYRFAQESEYSLKEGTSVVLEEFGRTLLFRRVRLFSFAELRTMGPDGSPAPQYAMEPFGTFRIDEDMEATRSDLFIRHGRREFHLQTGSWGPPMEALRRCVTDLIVSWGLDIRVQQRLRSLPVPIGDQNDWLNPADFPTTASQWGMFLTFHLMVDAQGLPTNCVAYGPMKPAGFGSDLCKALLARARFKPAVDEDGNPAESFWRSSATLLHR